jgi:PAS domain S-box-containing protein
MLAMTASEVGWLISGALLGVFAVVALLLLRRPATAAPARAVSAPTPHPASTVGFSGEDRAEPSLHAAWRALDAAFDDLPVPGVLVNRSCEVMKVNHAWRRNQDGPNASLPTLIPRTLLPEAAAPGMAITLRQLALDGFAAGSEASADFRSSSGVTRLFARPVRDRGAAVALLHADIPSDAYESEVDRHFLARVLDTTEALILVLGSDGRILRFNRACSRLTGFTEDEVVGRHFWESVIPQDEREQLRVSFTRLITTQQPRAYENDWIDRHGQRHTILWANSVVNEADGKVAQIISTGIDVTESRRLQQELIHAQRMEAIGQLAGGIAHDFNNLLTAIFGHIAIAKRFIANEHDAAASLERVEEAADQAGRIIRSLLTFSTNQRTEKQTVSASTILRETADLVAGLLPPNIRLHVPPATERTWIHADRLQIQQALLNLAINARDAMPSGGVLRLSLRTDSQHATFQVEDSGHGIRPEVLSRVTEPFFSTKGKGARTGLGLPVARSIATDHGGTLELTSEVGVGTQARMSIPIVDTEHTIARAPINPQYTPVRLIVASPRSYPRQIMITALSAIGGTVEQATDADSLRFALSHGVSGRASLLVIDASLWPESVPTHFRTLVVGSADRINQIPQGDFRILAEPFSTSQLVEAVHTMLDDASLTSTTPEA